MKSTGLLGLVGIVALLVGTSCSHKPEDFCRSWVESTCQGITSCCRTGTSFDGEGCRLSLSNACQKSTSADTVQTGEQRFDSGAASACFGTINSCADLQTLASDNSYAHVQACGNMVTGYRPVGAACGASSECQRAGDFAVCHMGVCAQVVLDPTSCSFSFATGELHVCADGTFCDSASFKPKPTDPPTTREYEFSASCKPDIGAGGDCFSAGQSLPCAKGLFCGASGGAKPKCIARKSAGAACQAQASDECADGLNCAPSGKGATCQAGAQDLSYCFSPTTCGDGLCQPPENAQTCPQDCGGGGGGCGDGICQPPENAQTCPQDCGNMMCTASCATAIVVGSTPCAGTSADADYSKLQACANAQCANECGGQFGTGSGLDSVCGGCLTTSCKTAQDTCNNN